MEGPASEFPLFPHPPASAMATTRAAGVTNYSSSASLRMPGRPVSSLRWSLSCF
ncbi:hypothetical protein JZ751_020301 [Albula glossodonta]|uniref:Uncharacterized protein n=1 Tax=Albula glossodonta TaxID=121402 RepID=A0A8T2NNQ5_9TELE|nr:hypothetical protein JZ751_020301 [Albula glossodonta]